jgi:predicted HAD superfamily hydrolase
MSANYVKIFPIVHVVNSTDEVLRNIYFTYEGMMGPDVKIKKIGKDSMEATAIVTKNANEFKKLFMYHYDEENIKHEYIITNRLLWEDIRDRKVEILAINEDGSYKIKIDHDFVLV